MGEFFAPVIDQETGDQVDEDYAYGFLSLLSAWTVSGDYTLGFEWASDNNDRFSFSDYEFAIALSGIDSDSSEILRIVQRGQPEGI